MASATSPIQTRPYRSHKVPACTRCRARKIRCHIDIPGEPCLSCRERRLKCQYVEPTTTTNSPTEESADKRPAKRRRHSEPDDGVPKPYSMPILHKSSNSPSASIMLVPHLAEDVDIFNRHISQHRKTGGDAPESSNYQTLLHDAQDPVVYLSVPRFRSGLPPGSGCGREQLDIVKQIMGPFKREVIELYLTNYYYNFPIIDDEMHSLLRKGQYDKVPNNIMCVLYAIGSPMWKMSDTLKMHPRPDSHYVWNKAISAVLEDFLSPGLSTVQAAVLDQIGRPSVSIVGNITLCGRTVSLAQTFGLHRDPSRWNITDNEKTARTRLWWGCLIIDHWASIAYGAPPHITKGYYDVPRPTVESLLHPKATAQQKQATTCFVHLCALTELLGEIHPLVYQIEPDRVKLATEVNRFKIELTSLEAQLPEWVLQLFRPGTCMLWLCFLSVRLLLARVTFRSAILDGNSDLGRERISQLRAASSAVLDFFLSLQEPQFQDFWLPYATYLFVHAITVSLRCTVETQDATIRNSSVSRLQRVMAHMQHARDNYDWDIAIYCVERCAEPVSRIVALNAGEMPPPPLSMTTSTTETDQAGTGLGAGIGIGLGTGGGGGFNGIGDGEGQILSNFDDASFLLSDMLDPNAFDLSWEALWNTPSGMMNFSI